MPIGSPAVLSSFPINNLFELNSPLFLTQPFFRLVYLADRLTACNFHIFLSSWNPLNGATVPGQGLPGTLRVLCGSHWSLFSADGEGLPL